MARGIWWGDGGGGRGRQWPEVLGRGYGGGGEGNGQRSLVGVMGGKAMARGLW